MDTLIIEWENFTEIAKIFISYTVGIVSFGSGLYAYIRTKGIRFASLEKVSEYRELKNIVKILTKNISQEEFLVIVKRGMEIKRSKKEGECISTAEKQELGMMLIDAIASEEIKK